MLGLHFVSVSRQWSLNEGAFILSGLHWMCGGLDWVSLQTFHCEYWSGIIIVSLRLITESVQRKICPPPSPSFSSSVSPLVPSAPVFPHPLFNDPGACPNLVMTAAWCSTTISLWEEMYVILFDYRPFEVQRGASLPLLLSPSQKKIESAPSSLASFLSSSSPIYLFCRPPPPPPPPHPCKSQSLILVSSLDVGKHGCSESVHQHLGTSRAS